MTCPVQHAPEAVRPPRSTNRATGTTNAMTTQKVAYAVQQDPPKPKSCDGNNGQKWTAVEKKKSMDESVPLIGRPYGGCSIIWSSNTSCKVDRIECISKRLCAVKVTVDGIEFVLFNMYVPRVMQITICLNI